MQVRDPRELELPDVGLIAVVDPETGRRRLVDTVDRGVTRAVRGASLRSRQVALTATPRLDRRRPPRPAHRPRLGARPRPLRRPASHPASHRIAAARPSSGPDRDRSHLSRPGRLLVLVALPIVLAVALPRGAGCAAAGTRCASPRSTCSTRWPRTGPVGAVTCRPSALLVGTVVASLAVARPAVAKELERATAHRRARDRHLAVDGGDRRRSLAARCGQGRRSRRSSTPCPTASRSAWSPSTSEARQLIQPTTKLDAVRRTIERADLGEGTAIGEAVFLALESIQPRPPSSQRREPLEPTRHRRARSCSSPTARPPTAGPTTRPPPRRRRRASPSTRSPSAPTAAPSRIRSPASRCRCR